jgi:hypothetical protein
MKKHLPKNPRLVFAIGMAIAILTTGLVISLSKQRVNAKDPGPDEKQSVTKRNARAYVTRNVGGQTVQIDPLTGQIRPLTPEEAKKLAEGLKELANQSTEGLQVVRHADGSVSMNLEGRFQNVAVAKRNDDGSVTQSCIDNPESGAAFFGLDPKLVGVKTRTHSAATKAPSNK